MPSFFEINTSSVRLGVCRRELKAFFCFGFGQSRKASGGRKLAQTAALFPTIVFTKHRFRCHDAAAALPRIAAAPRTNVLPGRFTRSFTLHVVQAQTGAAPKSTTAA